MITINTLLRTTFIPFSCNNETQVNSNEPYILRGSLAAALEAHDFGKQCLLAGQYTVNLTIPQQQVIALRRRRAVVLDSEIVVDSVRITFFSLLARL